MVIGKVHAVNFMCFEDVTYDLSLPGVTTVEGIIENKPGCTSNGAGKTGLLEALTWAIYDRCIRPDYNGDDVIRDDSTGGCFVEVDIVGGEQPLKVIHYRGHPDKEKRNKIFLFVDGHDVTAGTNEETKLAIVRQLGMDYTGFTNRAAFCARTDVKKFFTATDSERKAVLDNLLGLQLYADAERVTRIMLRGVLEESEKEGAEADRLNVLIGEKQALLARFGDKERMDEARIAVQGQKVIYRRVEKQVVAAKEEYDAALQQSTLHKAAHEGKVAGYQKALVEFRKSDIVSQSAIHQLLKDAGQADGERIAAEKHKAALAKLSGAECPLCEQVIKPAHVKAVAAKAEKEMSSLGCKADALVMEAEMKRNLLPLPPSPPDMQALNDARQATASAQSALANLEKRLQTIGAGVKLAEQEYDDAVSRVELTETEVQEMENAVHAHALAKQNLAGQIGDLAFWADGFGNKGLKSFLIEAEIPAINQAATGYVRQLCGEGAVVRLSPTKTLKSKKDAVREEITVEGMIPGCTRSYKGASTGQKTRMDLALILGMRDTRSAGGLNQLFVDELFDGLDSAGIPRAAAMLEELAETMPVLLVSHDDRLRDIGKQTLRVFHDGNGCATVETIGVAQSLSHGKMPVGKENGRKGAGRLRGGLRPPKKGIVNASVR